MYAARNPVEYVAPELWTKIFDSLQFSVLNCDNNITYKRSHHNCYKVCTTFRNILAPTRCSWLFQEIVSFITRYLTKSDFLNCRVVCNWWKYGIDQFIENEEHSIGLHRRHPPLLKNPRICFSTSEVLLSFLDNLKENPANPFPGRVLSLSFNILPTEPHVNIGYEEFWSLAINHLLCPLGYHLASLHLKFRFESQDWIVHSLHLLKACLACTPNLRNLCLAGQSPFHHNADTDTYSSTLWLPPLPSLETVKFSQSRCVEHRLCNSIPVKLQYFICSGYFRQLRRLDITFTDALGSSLRLHSAPLSNVEDIRVKVVSVKQLYYIFDFANNNAFTYLQSVTIEMMKLDTQAIKVKQATILGDILQLLELYKWTIRELAIVIDEASSVFNIVEEDEVKNLRQFRNLKYLRIQGFCFALVNLIQWLPTKLKHLHLCAYRRHDSSENELNVFMDLKYNEWAKWRFLWNSLPCLKWIRVDRKDNYGMAGNHTDTHQRDMWEWLVRTNRVSLVDEREEKNARTVWDGEIEYIQEEEENMPIFNWILAAIFGLAVVGLIVGLLHFNR